MDIESRSEADGATLRATGITKSYRRGWWPRRRIVNVLRGVDIELFPGEVVGLVGENGSGKSTLMKILVGAEASDAGSIDDHGAMGFCPQEPVLYQRLTCDEHIDLFGRAYGMTDAQIERARIDAYTSLGFAGWRSALVEELSGGTREKLNLALALLADPPVLLLDEPYAGFDWGTYLKFWEVTEQRRAAGRSVLIISHVITDVERFDRIYDLVEGEARPR